MSKRSFLLAAIVLAGCSSSATGQLDLEDLQGIWILETFDSQRVDVDVNSAGTPWIEINGAIEGSGGCNTFTMESFELDGNELHPGETLSTLAACLSEVPANDLMAAEEALHAVLSKDSISIELAGSTMRWSAGGTELSFKGTDVLPDN